jgi:Ca2+-binding EF-hand superfamily protein
LILFFSEFKECFHYHARKTIKTEDDLSVIMRSLGNSPTKVEISKYFSKYGPGKNNHDNLLKNIYIQLKPVLRGHIWDK